MEIMRFLMISKDYAPSSDTAANIVCYLAEEYVREGHAVDILTRESEIENESNSRNGVNVYRMKATLWDKVSSWNNNGRRSPKDKVQYYLMKIGRMAFLSFHISEFPNSEPISTIRALRFFEQNLSGYKYDYIITFFRPFSCMDLGRQIKKISTKAKLISFYLDLVEDRDRPFLMPQNLYNKLIYEGDLKIFYDSDSVILPVSAKDRKINLYDVFKNKIIYAEFPTFVKQNTELINRNKEEAIISFMYAGTLLRAYRDPSQMLILLSEMAKKNKNNNFRLDIYGGGDCSTIIEEFQVPSNLFIIQHGKVPKDEITKKTGETDILINITNALNSVVPSKIFEMFSSCKPILNVACNGDDGSMRYFNKYPIAYNAYWNGDKVPDKVINEFSDFVLKSKHSDGLDYKDIELIFETSTPKYVAKQIISNPSLE